MPRRNGMGPMGIGPMTGRGMGYCRREYSGNMGYGYGLGHGRRMGCGYGPGYGRGMGAYALSPEEEKAMLEEERDYLKSRLDEVDRVLEDFKEEQ